MTHLTANPETIELLRLLSSDFPRYARVALKVRSKSGAIQPFLLNRAQWFIHERIEEQRARTGKVRALILKGRQQGCSTYVEGRMFWRTVFSRGIRAFILTHEDAATTNLFEMAQRFLEHLPEPLRPSVDSQNAKELLFSAIDSGYKVGTAGNKSVGRSSTVQLFHGSEVAFWPNADQHAAGVIQTVPDAKDTEIIHESTANGLGNFFHSQWQSAERRESDYQAIFVPWYWQDEYRRTPPEGFALTAEEAEYGALYGLDQAQMCWRRSKISELSVIGDGEWKFKQEYPATAAEAFITSGDDSLIKAEIIGAARKCKAAESGPLLVGVDPARFGEDRTAIIRRRTRVAFGLETYKGKDTMEVAGIVVRIIEKEKPARVYIDVGGLGAGVVDRLRELGYGNRVEAVNFGAKASEPEKYANKRAECWGLMAEWLVDAPVQIPDSDTLHSDLIAPKYKYDSNSRLLIERKEDIKRRGLMSPDEADALAITFAAPLGPSVEELAKLHAELHRGYQRGY